MPFLSVYRDMTGFYKGFLMSILGASALALGGSALGVGANTATNALTAWSTNSARESLNKNIMTTNIKKQLNYERKSMQLDAAYEKWYQDMMYKLQANEYFDLAQRYGINTASWAVEGLKKAGLNPILAALDSNLSSSLGSASPQSSGGRRGGGSVHGSAPSSPSASDIRLSAMQDLINSGKQQSQIEAQTGLLESQKRYTDIQANNALKNEGLGGTFGAVANVLHQSGLKAPLRRLAQEGVKWLERKLSEDTTGSSAKSSSWFADIASAFDGVNSAKQSRDASRVEMRYREALRRSPEQRRIHRLQTERPRGSSILTR